MTINRKVTGTAMSIPAGVGLGTAVSVILTAIGCAILAWLLAEERMEETGIGYGAMGILLLSSVCGSLTAALLVKHRKMLVCLAVGTAYFALLLLVNGLAFGGALNGVWVTVLLILGGSTAAGLLTATQGAGSGRKTKIGYSGKNVQKFHMG